MSAELPPDKWRWGGARNPEPHVLLMLYARNEIALSELLSEQQSRFASAGLDSDRDSSRPPGCRKTRSILVFATASARLASRDFTTTRHQPIRLRPASSFSGISTRTGSTRSGHSWIRAGIRTVFCLTLRRTPLGAISG